MMIHPEDVETYANVPLWTWDKEVMYVLGNLADGTRFMVSTRWEEGRRVAILIIDDEEVKRVNFLSPLEKSSINEVTSLVDLWVKNVYWDNVPNPHLWAAAGCSPQEARTQLALPEGHQNRLSDAALEVLTALRQK